MVYKLEEVGRDVDMLKDAVKGIQKSDREQTSLLNEMKTSIAVIETNIVNMKESFDNIGKTLAWIGGAFGTIVTVATILNFVLG